MYLCGFGDLRIQEAGGYFIVNGIERIMRMLVMPRRNYVC